MIAYMGFVRFCPPLTERSRSERDKAMKSSPFMQLLQWSEIRWLSQNIVGVKMGERGREKTVFKSARVFTFEGAFFEFFFCDQINSCLQPYWPQFLIICHNVSGKKKQTVGYAGHPNLTSQI